MICSGFMVSDQDEGLGGVFDDDTSRAELRGLHGLDGFGLWAAGYSGEVLMGESFDLVGVNVADVAGRLRAAASARGRPIDPVDALIAASALVCGATVATRNVRDFEPLGVEIVDPWADY